ncbi:MAG: NACHT domain-containing protein [Symploca sp. SIO2C1]|nr:NACHT domain-containing protein [Symploca sp. SIO2C1]
MNNQRETQIIINLEDGDFEGGFSPSTIQVQWSEANAETNATQLCCPLPQAPQLPAFYRQWQNQYQGFLQVHHRGIDRSQPMQISMPEYIAECDQFFAALHQNLNHWLSTIKKQLAPTLELDSQDEVRIVVQTSKISCELTKNILHRLPWHWWDLFPEDCFTEAALCFAQSEPIAPDAKKSSMLDRIKRVKILCVLGDNGEGIDVEADRRLFRKIPGAYCVFLRQPTLAQLESFLNERWDILFFAGHSDTPDGGKTGLLKINSEEYLDIQTIRDNLKKAIKLGMKLAIFNSCNGLGLAHQIADLNIAQIIVWREPVLDTVAQEFLKYFLESFTEGLSLYHSVKEARLRLQEYIEKNGELPKVSWLPVIHQNLGNEQITWNQLRGYTNEGNPAQGMKRKKNPREILLDKVEQSWIEGVLEKALHIEETIELGLEKPLDAVTPVLPTEQELPHQEDGDLPEGTRAIDIFGELENKRTMLILGEPGSGKTTALLEIARELISDATQDTSLPIPVVLNLSSWGGERQPKPLAEWLIQELHRIYQFPIFQCKAWINNQQLLLLLDGLDTVKETRRSTCIRAINQFLRTYGRTQMVVCSRTADYKQVSEKLQLQIAVVYKSLTSAQINRYLDDAQENLPGVRALLREEQTMQDLVDTPLNLNIVAVAYEGKSQEELAGIDSLEERRQHLFKTYIQRRFEQFQSSQGETGNQQYTEQQARHWLNWLAQSMVRESQSLFLIEQMQPNWLPVGAQNWIYPIVVRLIFGIIFGLVGVLHFGAMVTKSLTDQISLVIPSVIAGIISVLSSLIIPRLISRIIPSFIPRNISKFISVVPSGLIYATIIAPITYAMFGDSVAGREVWRSILSPAIVDGVVVGIILSLVDQEIGIIDTLQGSWQKAKKYSMIGLLLGSIYVLVRLIFSNKYGSLANLSEFKYVAIIIELIIFTLLPGLLGGLDKGVNLEQTIIANQGIWRSATNAGILFGIFFPIGMLVSLPYIEGVIHEVISIGLAVGLLAGMAGGRGPVLAGFVLIQHFTLRVLLWWKGYIPWNYALFLDYATEHIFLQKVGGGYIFIHQTLMEHFAQLQEE